MKKVLAVILSLLILTAAVPIMSSAEEYREYPDEDLINDIFLYMGISTWGSDYFGCDMLNPEGAKVPDGVVHQYLQSSGQLNEFAYEKEINGPYGSYFEYGYELRYDVYMSIVDNCFVNHSNMKEFISSSGIEYNETTNMLKWQEGGFGGPSDWVVDEINYVSDDTLYCTGKYIEYGYSPSDFAGLTENYDYVAAEFDNAMINHGILLTLKRVDGIWKILEYRDIPYHIEDGVLYELDERTAFSSLSVVNGQSVVKESESSKAFTSSFYGNPSKWYKADSELSFTVKANNGYAVSSVTLKDAAGEKEIIGKDGVYTFSPEGSAVLTVKTVKTAEDRNEITIPEDTDGVKLSENKENAYAVSDMTVDEILSAVQCEAEIIKADGNKASENDILASGMRIVLKDKDGNTVDERTVIVPGDVDGDAGIKAADARLVLRSSVGLEELESWGLAAADVDGEAGVKAGDARNILRASVSLEENRDWFDSLS